MILQGEGQYNLNILKEIAITSSFLGLDKDVIKCQSLESYDKCTTRDYHELMRKECGCLPFAINRDKEVWMDLSI